MNCRRTFLTLALTCLSFLALLAAPAAAQSTACPPHRGHAVGVWHFSDNAHPGLAEGVLFEDGTPRFVFKAALIPGSPPGTAHPDGRIQGRLYRITSSGVEDQPFAIVRGVWAGGPDGNGVFKTKVLRPTADGTGLKVIGHLGGHYHDRPGDGGTFHGHWVIHP